MVPMDFTVASHLRPLSEISQMLFLVFFIRSRAVKTSFESGWFMAFSFYDFPVAFFLGTDSSNEILLLQLLKVSLHGGFAHV